MDHFVAPSDHLRDKYVEWGLAPERISVIANGHRRARASKWAPSPSPNVNVFGYFGQFVNAKGIDILLEAAAHAARFDTVEVKIFGGNKEYATAEYTERIDSILRQAPDNLSVNEVGSYSRQNVFELMCTVDWVVVPSVWPETFGLVVSEAWDARRPVIASSVGGLRSRIEHGRNGLCFMPGSSGQLASLITSCLDNAELWHRLVDGIEDEISLEQAWVAHKELFSQLGAVSSSF